MPSRAGGEPSITVAPSGTTVALAPVSGAGHRRAQHLAVGRVAGGQQVQLVAVERRSRPLHRRRRRPCASAARPATTSAQPGHVQRILASHAAETMREHVLSTLGSAIDIGKLVVARRRPSAYWPRASIPDRPSDRCRSRCSQLRPFEVVVDAAELGALGHAIVEEARCRRAASSASAYCVPVDALGQHARRLSTSMTCSTEFSEPAGDRP